MRERERRAERSGARLRARREKKPGPRGPGFKFASVGAPANHLPEGKNCGPAAAKSGRIAAHRLSAVEQYYAKRPRIAQHGAWHASHALSARSSQCAGAADKSRRAVDGDEFVLQSPAGAACLALRCVV